MISPATFKFLAGLKRNNERDWFHAHRAEYEAARAEFEAFLSDLLRHIADFDPAMAGVNPRKAIFRINRDTRFSKDKSPYKTNFGAHLVAPGQSSREHGWAGYYIHVQPGFSMLGGGAYMPTPEWLRAIRRKIDAKGAALKKLAAAPAFKKTFGKLEGETLKTAPQGYSPDHPHIDLLRYKSLFVIRNLKDKEMQAPGFAKQAAGTFKTLKPLNDFLNNVWET
jgi:uncharacterized protein (TIGR02453 family)